MISLKPNYSFIDSPSGLFNKIIVILNSPMSDNSINGDYNMTNMTNTTHLEDIPVIKTTEHKQYNLGSRYNNVLKLAQEQYQHGRQEVGLNIVRAWEALPEGAVQWLCQQSELPIEDGKVMVYWPPLNEEMEK